MSVYIGIGIIVAFSLGLYLLMARTEGYGAAALMFLGAFAMAATIVAAAGMISGAIVF